MNPCPCGCLGQVRCRCTQEQVQCYRAKISDPLLDRIDMLLEVPPVDKKLLWLQAGETPPESSERVRQRAVKANATLQHKQFEVFSPLCDQDFQLVEQAISRLGLSTRAYHRILKVAHTIADLAGNKEIQTSHLNKAIGYRRLDTQH